jgi:TrpR-related protein YerC/YecD
LAVAEMLNDGEKYQTIEAATGASTATISRVNKCLNYGSGGYRTVLDKMKASK